MCFFALANAVFSSLINLSLVLVSLQVAVQVELREEPSVAVLAGESSLTLMDFKMLVQVGFLGE